ncbi:hypothetical protein C5689_08830 [Methylosinus sporium]|uniref:DUF4265 domain-containing protein n=2 Tax=Methylosinus sporium TaxID=428 RepID=A0A2U1SRH1_METSR|nr:hypothetical protein C5689_08830 [Methylosinus sporium]
MIPSSRPIFVLLGTSRSAATSSGRDDGDHLGRGGGSSMRRGAARGGGGGRARAERGPSAGSRRIDGEWRARLEFIRVSSKHGWGPGSRLEASPTPSRSRFGRKCSRFTSSSQSFRFEKGAMVDGKPQVLFSLDPQDWHGHGTETLWAEPVEGSDWTRFRLLNSPYFVMGVAFRDIVVATPRAESGIFDFTRVAETSGHSTYMLLVDGEEVLAGSDWRLLKAMGCSYESMHVDLTVGRKLLLSVDIPDLVDIAEAHAIIAEGESKGFWLYQIGATTFIDGMLPIW